MTLNSLMNHEQTEFKQYNDPEAVGGWKGWYEFDGTVFAFEDVDGKITPFFADLGTEGHD